MGASAQLSQNSVSGDKDICGASGSTLRIAVVVVIVVVVVQLTVCGGTVKAVTHPSGGSKRQTNLTVMAASDGHWSPEVHWNDGAEPDWSKGVPIAPPTFSTF
ncbi:unnamed protein product [Gongylonema pulchrum]|uniref:Uncharacterized protein n=1 Tax=Gongylonema pulchrum TaxID=637853 RepID=A0A183EB17_9BILA|nr:unnamed protein product [Gongylonema pulchrum]